jgi:DMSO/TMAO reductase YedYZ molybdopterin-dependent catalytic subunit
LPFVPFELFDWLARVLPGGLLTLVIDSLVRVIHGLNLGDISSTAKLVEQWMAVAGLVAAGGAIGAGVAWGVRRTGLPGWQVGLLGGALLTAPAAVAEASQGGDRWGALGWVALITLGWGAALGGWLEGLLRERVREDAAGTRVDRRTALVKIAGGSLALALVWAGLGRWLGDASSGLDEGEGTGLQPRAGSPLLQAAPGPVPQRGVELAPGTRPEVTPTAEFYRIDINLMPLRVPGDTWQLEVDGLFERPGLLTLTDMMRYPAVTVPITLSCISNPIGGDLIGTGQWTGVRLVDFLLDRGLRAEARALRIVASDGFFESVTREDMEDPRTLLVYGMNGEVLPNQHGYPLRVLIPNRYGMKQPKWIRRMEAIDHEGEGYWVVRGWSKEARPRIVSMIDTIPRETVIDGRIPIGGIAWAGDRGIERVEVQVDDGPWSAAQLLAPALGDLTWVPWRYEWPRATGRHRFRVRAVDGTGAMQIGEPGGAHPDGATGYHERTMTI